MERLLYWTKQFRASVLLPDTGQRPWAGRPERLYRAVSSTLVVPFALTPFADLEAQTSRQAAGLQRLEAHVLTRTMASSTGSRQAHGG